MRWRSSPLADVLADAKSGFACGDDPPDGVFQFRMNNVTADGRLDLSKRRRVPRDTRYLAAFFLEPGDVLFNATNSPELVGKTAFISDLDEPTVFSNHFIRLRPNARTLDGRFLARWLQLQFQRRVFEGICRQWVNQATVGKDALLALQMPVPPLEEQRRIAELLDRADALRAKRRAALAQLDIFIEAIFLDLFEAPGAYGWPESTIASLAAAIPNAIRTGPFGSQLLHSEFVESGIAVLGIDNVVQNQFVWARPRFIVDKKYRQLQRYTVFPGDVLITIMGTCGRCAVVPEGIPTAINTKHLCCITLDGTRCLPVYLQACFLLHPKVQHRLGVRERGAVMPGLNMQIIRELRVPLPPLEVQRDFVHRVTAVEALKRALRSSLFQLNALFDSVQHRAFHGEL